MQGQLGTPSGTVRGALILSDSDGAALTGEDTYTVTVPAGIVRGSGYFSVTVYGADNTLLIPNALGVYDRTTYSSEAEPDGTYSITLALLVRGRTASRLASRATACCAPTFPSPAQT